MCQFRLRWDHENLQRIWILLLLWTGPATIILNNIMKVRNFSEKKRIFTSNRKKKILLHLIWTKRKEWVGIINIWLWHGSDFFIFYKYSVAYDVRPKQTYCLKYPFGFISFSWSAYTQLTKTNLMRVQKILSL